MPYKQRIATLTESHRLIDKVINEKMAIPNFDEFKLKELKKQKLIYKDDIRRMELAQQDHDAEIEELK